MYAIINQLIEPMTLLIAALCYLVFILWRTREVSRRRLISLVIVAAGLYLYCTPAVAYLLLGSLEWKYPPTRSRPDNIEAIVILSGGVYAPDEVRPEPVLGERTIYRCLRGGEIFDPENPCPIILAGGMVNANREGPSLARSMKELMHGRLGIDEKHLILEDKSRSTYENAVNSCDWLKKNNLNRVVLVTDATHLYRSELCFRKQGVDVIPVGCAYRATKFRWDLNMFLPSPAGAEANRSAFHEYLGIVWYWLKGRI